MILINIPHKKGRKPDKQLDNLASEVRVAPEGKAVPVSIPTGKTFRQFRQSLYRALGRRGMNISITQINEQEIAVWLRQ